MPDVTPQQIAADQVAWSERIERELLALRGVDLCIQPIHNRLNAQLKVIERLEAEILEVRNLVIGLGIDTTEETERLDAHVSALEAVGAPQVERLLRAELVDTKRERDEALHSRSETLRLAAERDSLTRSERDALQQQLAECRAALAKYGCHLDRCAVMDAVKDAPCTCGLALATTSEEREG